MRNRRLGEANLSSRCRRDIGLMAHINTIALSEATTATVLTASIIKESGEHTAGPELPRPGREVHDQVTFHRPISTSSHLSNNVSLPLKVEITGRNCRRQVSPDAPEAQDADQRLVADYRRRLAPSPATMLGAKTS